MILELNGTKVTIVDKTLGYQGDNLVDTIQVTVDKDSTWNYKLDMYKGKSKCFDSVLMTREGNICTVQLTNEILSYGGRYIFQLRGYTDTQTYHSDIFESWVNASIEYQDNCKQTDCGCDCKLPTEFYQVEDNVTEINNHPPYPGDNNKWMIWDVNKHQYVESDIDVIAGGEDYQTKANLTTSITAESTDEQYPSAKATYDAIQAAKPDIVTPSAESTDTQAASAKAVWDMLGAGGSGTDISLGLTGAAVGDIIKVKAVDDSGKPTEWEAADIIDDTSDCVKNTATVEPESEYWSNFKNFMGRNPSVSPIPEQMMAPLESAGMITANADRWKTGQQGMSTKGELSDSTFVQGGHIFEGWDTEKMWRLTMLIGKFAVGNVHIYAFKPNESGVEEFGIVTIGSDHKWEGLDVAQKYAYMNGNMIASSFSGANNYGSQKYYGGISGTDKKTPAGANMEITAGKNSDAPNRVQFNDCNNGMKIPVLESDPTVLEDGVFWFNSAEGAFKGVVGGEIKVFTLS